jgi:N-acetylglutamate synthase-like GNAT family acetyltransferase
MTVTLRPGVPGDAEVAGRICYDAFASIAAEHHFPCDFPSPEVAEFVVGALLGNPRIYSVVAEVDGRVAGSNFLDERCPIAGVGPITVDPAVQNDSVGRQMMVDVMRRAAEQGFPGVRLVQSGYHNRSFALYAKLGFEVREQLACVQGPPVGGTVPGHAVRRATTSDLEACNRLCQAVHGHHRSGELADAIAQGSAKVVEHAGRLTGYATDLAFFAHAVGESNEDLKALIGAADVYGGPGMLVPTRNAGLVRWCLDHGLRVTQLMTLMSTGMYSEPAGSWMPSVLF